jgi:prolycopene isomerase
VEADAVVSNADLRSTLEELLPPGAVDGALLERVRRMRRTFPCYLVHLGVSGVGTERLARAQGYYWRTWDPDAVGGEGLRCKVFVPTLYEPRMAPPGKHVVILQKVVDEDPAEVTDWGSHKAAVERRLLGELESAMPGIGEHVEVRSTASADTARRFTLNQGGAMLGWEMSPEQLGTGRPDVRGPLPGLFLTGHWVRPGGGIAPVIVSARLAARAVLEGSFAGPGAGSLPGETDPDA